jgi:tRNA pseudouridine55 synthase
MQEILNLYKPQGLTPLQVIEKFKELNPEYKEEKMTYAGRLDPMAEGVILILSGDEKLKREEYLNLDKEYKAKILFGIGTDSYDLLGKPISEEPKNIEYKTIEKVLSEFKGENLISLPPYSSPPVKGKPLFEWARENRLDEIEIPTKEMLISQIELVGISEIQTQDLLQEIKNRINNVSGDFRQGEILKEWGQVLKEDRAWQLAEITLQCSSGTYVRSIANELGKRLGTKSVLFSLIRSKVGPYRLDSSIQLLDSW